MSFFDDVVAFHERFCQPHPGNTRPRLMDAQMLEFRMALINEELDEFVKAHARGDLPEAIDGLVDIAYVILGTAAVMGAPFDDHWAEVHRANIDKVPTPGPNPAIVKPTKPPGWRGPDHETILRAQWRKRCDQGGILS